MWLRGRAVDSGGQRTPPLRAEGLGTWLRGGRAQSPRWLEQAATGGAAGAWVSFPHLKS